MLEADLTFGQKSVVRIRYILLDISVNLSSIVIPCVSVAIYSTCVLQYQFVCVTVYMRSEHCGLFSTCVVNIGLFSTCVVNIVVYFVHA